jgi:sugar transferase (PEP-CTERM/EpsH1 system associated)
MQQLVVRSRPRNTAVARPLPTICQLLHGLRVGGAEVLAARLARGLSDQYRFIFACLDEIGTLGEQLRQEGFMVEVLHRREGVDWRCPWRLARLLRRERVELVHAHQYTPFFYALTARLFYRRPVLLFNEHGRHHPDFPRPKRIFINRLLLRRRDRVVAVGRAVANALIRNEGIPERRVDVIYNGIDLPAFSHRGHDRGAIRRELGAGADDLVILQVARLDYLKDHATAVAALAEVVRRRKNARLILVGEGPEEKRIADCIRHHDLGSHVRLLGLRTDISRLLSAADIFLLTSISEGIPLTVIEAMAAGLPVVSTNVGGVAEIALDGCTAFLAPAGDYVTLAEHILRLAENATLRRAMGQHGRQRARQMFSERQMHASYLQCYRDILHD